MISPGVSAELACKDRGHWLHFVDVRCGHSRAMHKHVGGTGMDLTCTVGGQPAECACKRMCTGLRGCCSAVTLSTVRVDTGFISSGLEVASSEPLRIGCWPSPLSGCSSLFTQAASLHTNMVHAEAGLTECHLCALTTSLSR